MKEYQHRGRLMFVLLTLVCSVVCAVEGRAEEPSEPRVLGFDLDTGVAPYVPSRAWHEGISLDIGPAYEWLTNRTATRFHVPNLGVSLGMTQKIRGNWHGMLRFWFSRWTTRPENQSYLGRFSDPFVETAPVRGFSQVAFALSHDPDGWLFEQWDVFKFIRPRAFAGLGFVTFLAQRGWPLARGEQLLSEAAIRYGLGAQVVVVDRFCISLDWDIWRGVRTFSFTGRSVSLSLEFGDFG